MRILVMLLMFISFSAFAEPVNINKGSATEIAAALDGVGDKKAQEIVKYRKKNGPFKSINELSNVKGIGDKTVAKNKKDIKLK